MKKQLQQFKAAILFTLTLMLLSMMGVAQTAFITDAGHYTVSIINVAADTVIATIPVGAYPTGVSVTPDGSKIYVANTVDGTVSVINCATHSVLDTITVGDNPTGVSVSPDGNKVYVTNEYDNSVSVISTAADTVLATITGFNFPTGIIVSPDGNMVYVANSIDNTVSVLNTVADTISANITVGPPGCDPKSISVTPDGSKIYVTYSYSIYNQHTDWYNYYAGISVISAAKDTLVNTIPINAYETSIGTLTVSPDGSKLYVTYLDSNADGAVSVINTVTDSISATIPGFGGPTGASVTPDGSKLLVCNYNDNTVSVVNISTNSISTTISIGTIGTEPTGIVISTCTEVPLGITSFNDDASSISIYPNPATNQLTIHTSSFHNEAVMVTVINVLGEIMKGEKTIWNNDIGVNIRNLASGIYFLKLKTENESVVKKFVKE